jgi:hypothetical protein
LADYTNYVGPALYSIEQIVRREFKAIWTRAHPFFAIMKHEGGHWNKGFDFSGWKMLLGIAIADQTNPAAGVSVANELTAMTANTYNGDFQLEYQVGHYRSNVTIRSSDQRLVASNEVRGRFLDQRKKQCLDSFKNVISSDVIVPTAIPTGTNSDVATNAVQSLRYLLSNANVVGGKDQNLDTNWQAQYNTASGPFNLDLVDKDMDAVQQLGRTEIDYFLAAQVAAGNVYGKFRSAITPGERYTNDDFTRKTGIKSYMYRGATVVLDNRNTGNELIGLSSSTLYVHLPDEPTVCSMQRIPLSTAYEQAYEYWAAIGIDDCACNIRRTGLT